MELRNGHFYEFHRVRAVGRPGAEIRNREGIEVGPELPTEKEAIRKARAGWDVYTPQKQDAKSLATKLYSKAPEFDGAHGPLYYPHYHPGGVHAEVYEAREGRPRAVGAPGHVFFGRKGQERED